MTDATHDQRPRNAMREHNPENWDPDPDAFESTDTNIWDPVEGQGYTEPGHWAARDPDMDVKHARRLALRGEFEGADHLPLISSDMRGVPTEGMQGDYTRVTRLGDPCPECTFDYGLLSRHTMHGVGSVKCLACDHLIEQL